MRMFLATLGLAVAGLAQTGDTFLPWEGGPAYYKKWANGPSSDPSWFPVAVWLQNPKLASEYKAIGVNLFVGLWKGPTREQLAALEAAGMPVLAAQKTEGLQAGIVRGWTMMDEPDNAQPKAGGGWGPCIFPPVIVERYEKLKAADATRPVYLNLGQGVINERWKGRGECGKHPEHYAEYIRGTDIVSYDVYPVNSKLPLWYVGAGVKRLREWAGYSKPVWNWIEASSIRGEGRPTARQIKAEVWMSLIQGSMGIGYFCHQFKPTADEAAPLHDAEIRKGLAGINGQITELAPVLNTRSVANGVTVSSPQVDTMLKRHGGATYLFAVNSRPGETTAEFKLRGCGTLNAVVLGETRNLPVKNGVLTDRFADDEVHLYKIAFVPAQ